MLDWFDMDYKNQAVSEDLSLAEIEPMLTSVVVVVVAEEEIKNSGGEGVIYTIPTAGKHGILPESGGLRGVCLVVLSLA